MNILVCIKQVPGSNKVQIDLETGTLIRTKDNNKINPYDLFAIETALRLREEYGGTVCTLTMGPPQAKQVIQESIAMGCDKGFLLSDKAFAGSDVLSTSYALSQAIIKCGVFDLILCGKQTTDGDTAQVGVEVAELLNLPNLSNVVSIKSSSKNTLLVDSNQENLFITHEIQLPCLINLDNEINTPRLPSYRRMKAQMDIKFITLEDMEDKNKVNYGLDGSATQVEKIFPPDKTSDRYKFEGNSNELSTKIYDLLLEKKFLI
ncbi:MAG: electron transfer flavoprotein subunit beta/FixA family protein [Sphaerochaetaceae bacterium]|nr:electron transfer flavoprotein subunit beta/FixA family protein [Sphaerochaetaceae bacterium]